MSRAGTSPVVRFLGERESRGGALALLGLEAIDLDERAVIVALNQQLSRVNAHPERDTPAADEVRLALHAAAAQMLDPAVRALVIARARGVKTAPPPARETRPPVRAPSVQTPSDVDPMALEHDALRLLARTGGWRADSFRQLAQLAAARGVPIEQIVRGMQSMLRSPRDPASTRSAPGEVATNSTGAVGSAFGTTQVVGNGSIASPNATGAGIGAARVPTVAAPKRDDSPSVPRPALPIDGLDASTSRVVLFAMIGLGVFVLVLVGIGLVILGGSGQSGAVQVVPTPSPQVSSSAPAPAPAAQAVPSVSDAAPDGRDRSMDDAVVATRDSSPSVQGERTAGSSTDVDALIASLRAATEALSTDARSASAAFASGIETLSRVWVRLAPAQRAAAHDAVVEFVYRAGEHDGALALAMDRIAMGAQRLGTGGALLRAGDVAPAVWSVGMVARLSRERDLAERARAQLEAVLTGALGTRGLTGERVFDDAAQDGLRAAARALAERGGGSPEAWGKWVECARALSAGDRARETTLILRGLDALLEHGPDADRVPEVFASIGLMVESLAWARGDPTRDWLVARFDSPRVSAGDLNALTTALATRVAPEGVDLSMVVRLRDSESERRTMRDRYAQAWGIAAPAGSGAWASSWLELLQRAEAMGDASRPRSSAEWLREAVILSLLNESASLGWAGDASGSEIALDSARQFVERRDVIRTQGPISRGIERGPADGWWSRYLRAPVVGTIRIDMLRDLNSRPSESLSRQDGLVLVREALRGQPSAVREAAAGVVRRHGASPAVILALIDELPRTADTRTNRDMIAAVTLAPGTPRDGEAWVVHARRTLAARLLELTASAGDLASVDELATVLSESYARRAPGVSVSEGIAPEAEASAASLRSAMERTASSLVPGGRVPLTLDEIERRRVARSGLAQGAVQRFAVEQLAACEMLAYVVALERPAAAERAERVLDELALTRRSARHVFQQLAAVERAAARLWRLRYGELES